MSDPLRDLVSRLGGDYHGSYVSLPGPGHSPKDRSLAVKLGANDRLVYFSHAGDSHRDVQAYLGAGAERLAAAEPTRHSRAQGAERRQRLEFCAALWRASQPLSDTIGEWYLGEVRGCRWTSQHLRFHPACPNGYQGELTYPAILAFVTDRFGAPSGLHATLLRPDGSDKLKRLMFGYMHGGAVRLGEPTVNGVLGVAEGIETALSFAMCRNVPTWAALSCAGVKTFEPPPGVRQLVIAEDDDVAGREAADALCARLNRRLVIVRCPAPAGDWNDVVQEMRRGR